MAATSGSRLPSFSMVLETVNLELADLESVRRSLHSVAAQDLSPATANEVVMVESGELPEGTLSKLAADYPWLCIVKAPPDSGYEEAKIAGVSRTSGDVVVFFDSDCVYEAGWLRGLIEGLGERPDIDVLGGETMIRTDSAWALASAVLFSFEFYSGREAVYDAERFHFNNVAFRRAVLNDAPPPVRLPVFRVPTTFYAALLRQRGFRIGRQPKSRARHQPPNGLAHFFWRFLIFGLDGVNALRLPWPDRAAGPRNRPASRTYLLGRFAAIGAGHTAKVGRRLFWLAREAPGRLLYFPLALPLILGGGMLMVAGFLSGLLAPKFLPSVMPASVRRGSAYAERRGP
ncbi:MAG: glycosyltransferase [Alphaproteobacteria bacterium]